MEIQQLFEAANRQRVRDLFGKTQRKNVERWVAASLEMVQYTKWVSGGGH